MGVGVACVVGFGVGRGVGVTVGRGVGLTVGLGVRGVAVRSGAGVPGTISATPAPDTPGSRIGQSRSKRRMCPSRFGSRPVVVERVTWTELEPIRR